MPWLIGRLDDYEGADLELMRIERDRQKAAIYATRDRRRAAALAAFRDYARTRLGDGNAADWLLFMEGWQELVRQVERTEGPLRGVGWRWVKAQLRAMGWRVRDIQAAPLMTEQRCAGGMRLARARDVTGKVIYTRSTTVIERLQTTDSDLV